MKRSQHGRFQGREARIAALEGEALGDRHVERLAALRSPAWQAGESERHARLGRRLNRGDVLPAADLAFIHEIDARLGWSEVGCGDDESYAEARARILDEVDGVVDGDF